MDWLRLLAHFLYGLFRNRLVMAAENLALRQQLVVLTRSVKRPRLRQRDRLFWVTLSRLWQGWRSCLTIVQPETVIGWHRRGFKLYWRWKSRPTGRPTLEREIRDMVRRLAHENPLWGAPRMHSELTLLGYTVAQSTVSKYLRSFRKSRPPSQNWRTFLKNHAGEIVALDFFTVATMTFRTLCCFVILRHERRHIVHFHVTDHPTAVWIARQITEAFPYEAAPRYLLRDRDGVYGQHFRDRVRNLGSEEVLIAPQSPWQNPYVERLIGTIRRECLDHVIVLHERHLRRTLASFFAYYHEARTHLSLARNAPCPREVEPRHRGRVVAVPHLGGLHHRYTRVSAA
jgi:putative transposase